MQASKSPLLVGSHRTLNYFNNKLLTHVKCLSEKRLETQCPRFLLGLATQVLFAQHAPKFQSPRRRASVQCKLHCLHRLGTVNTLISQKMMGAPSKYKNGVMMQSSLSILSFILLVSQLRKHCLSQQLKDFLLSFLKVYCFTSYIYAQNQFLCIHIIFVCGVR